MAEHVGRRAHFGLAGDEAVDLLAPGGERHRAVEARDAPRMELVQLTREPDHGAPREGDDHRARAEARDAAAADPVERRLALEEPDLGLRERVPHERQRLNRAEQQDVAVLAAEQEPGPRGAALFVLRPLHLVEDERLAARRGHLGRAAHDRRVGIDALLTGHEADPLLADLGRQPPVCLLREHAQRRRVDAVAVLDEEAERVVRLAGVGRPEVGDHGLGLDTPLGQPHGQLGDRPSRRRVPPPMPLAAARSLLPPLVSAPGHGATVARPAGSGGA